jgi:uncharacterized RmlC-like cupin family protein
MNSTSLRYALLSATLWVAAVACAYAQSFKPARLTSGDLTWNQTPGFPWTAKIQPHFHFNDRIVVVLSGTLYVGYGTQFEETQLKALPAGSIWTEPAKQPHFAWAKDGEVIIQATGIGPLVTTQVCR